MTARAAGVLLFARSTGRVLFLLRRDCECWATPGGHVEPGETEEQAAVRELFEEARGSRVVTIVPESSTLHGGYRLFEGEVPRQYDPVLNEEHSDWTWAYLEQPPQPLHHGLAAVLGRFRG